MEPQKYAHWYDALINKARGRTLVEGYAERHHVVPRSMGGSDQHSNIVVLTAKEHFVAHHLLARIHGAGMWNAFFLMHVHSTDQRHFTARTYELAKRRMAEFKARQNAGENNPYYGRKHSEETRAKMRAKRVGRVCRLDRTIYSFEHPEHGIHKTTQTGLCQMFGLCNKGLNAVARGRYTSYKGWRLAQGENGRKT